MKIVQLTLFLVRIPLRKVIRHASHERSSTDNIVVRCVLENGTEGYGEGVPREYVTGETVESAAALVKQAQLPAQLEPAPDLRSAIALVDRLEFPSVPGDDRGIAANAARCAVELAILDAFCKQYRVSLSQVTPLVAPELHAQTARVRYSGVITSASGFKARLAAWKMRVYGFHQVKVKVGIEGQDDVARLRIIRRRVGNNTAIRIDANEAWAPEEAVGKIRELAPFQIASVEQPVAHGNAGCLARIRSEAGVPIMLDESLCGMPDAERAVREGLADAFNLRLSKCGGFLRTFRLAQFARAHGLFCQLGCQVGETAILSAAGRHFAASVGGLRSVEGSYDRHLVKEALGTQDITFGWGGWAPALEGPGLGIRVDPAALERVALRKEPLLG